MRGKGLKDRCGANRYCCPIVPDLQYGCAKKSAMPTASANMIPQNIQNWRQPLLVNLPSRNNYKPSFQQQNAEPFGIIREVFNAEMNAVNHEEEKFTFAVITAIMVLTSIVFAGLLAVQP